MGISPEPWNASEPHPNTGECVITNAQGRVIARVPRREDAIFICQARETYVMPESINIQVDWKAFGAQVAAARKAKRYSQDIAAQMCGISRNYISQIERGSAEDPSYRIVLTLCMWLGLEMPQPRK
jgi:DNA-binding XRE family transcriptional regulator